MCLDIIARREKSKLNLRKDESGMANPLAGERWRSRHDGERQRPSSGSLWDRDDLWSVRKCCPVRCKGLTRLAPLALMRSGAIHVPHSTSGRDAARTRCSRQSPSGGAETSIWRGHMSCWTSAPTSAFSSLVKKEERRGFAAGDRTRSGHQFVLGLGRSYMRA